MLAKVAYQLPYKLTDNTASRPSTSRMGSPLTEQELQRPLITRSAGVSPTACQFGRYIDSTCGGGTR